MFWKKTFILVLFLHLFSIIHLSAQVPQWNWVIGANSGNEETASAIAYDSVGGAAIVVGQWETNINTQFPGLFNTYGGSDGFVTRILQNGTVDWAFRVGGVGNDFVTDVAVDPAGNIYLIGGFVNVANFIGIPPSTNMQTTALANQDVFVTKYTSAGVLLWVQHFSSGADVNGCAIATGPNGVYITGDYGPDTLRAGALKVGPIGGGDMFTAKLNANNGSVVWLKRAGGNLADFSLDIAVDATHAYILGNYDSPNITYDGAGLLTNVSTGLLDISVAKLDESNGNVVWSEHMGGVVDDEGNGIALDQNSVYVTGGMDDNGSFVFFPGTTRTTGNSGLDIFVTSLSKATAQANWAVVESNTVATNSLGRDLVVDGSGTVYVTGIMGGITAFNAGLNPITSSNSDIFISAYQASTGNYVWAKGSGSTGNDEGFGIDKGPSGIVYATGTYTNTAMYDLLSLPTGGGNNFWVGKLGDQPHTAVPDTFCNAFQTSIIMDVLANEVNPGNTTLTTTEITAFQHGTSAFQSPDSLIYTPGALHAGWDSLFYEVCGGGNCDSAWVKIYTHGVADAGMDTTLCGPGFMFAANTPFPISGVGAWNLISGAGIVTPNNLPNATLSGLGPGFNEFEWSVDYGFCISRDTISISSDNLPPTISCGTDTTVVANATCQFTIPDFTSRAIVSDNCSLPVVTQSPAPFTTLLSGTHPITLYATDQAGNQDSCKFDLIVAANVNPQVITCGTAFIGETTQGMGNNQSNFNCVGFNTNGEDQFYQMTVPAGTYWIQVTMDNVVDPDDNQTELFWIGGACPLTGNCVQHERYNIPTQEFNANSSNLVRFLAVGPGTYYLAVDNRTNAITSYDISFDCVNSGIEFDTTMCTGDPDRDGVTASLNASTSNLTVAPCERDTLCHTLFIANVLDIEWMDSVHFDLGSCYTNVNPIPTAGFYANGNWAGTYNAGNQEIVWQFNNTNNPLYGDGVGNNPYNCNAYDLCFATNISASCDTAPDLDIAITIADDGVGGAGATSTSYDVVLSNDFLVQDPPPGVTCPPARTLVVDSSSCSVIDNTLSPLITDNCPGPFFSYVLSGATIGSGNGSASGVTLNLGNTLVQYIVRDPAGNGDTCTFLINVIDTIPPSITCPMDTTVTVGPSCQYVLPDFASQVSGLNDNCSLPISLTLVQSPSPTTIINGNTTITMTVTDGFGNAGNCTFNVLFNQAGQYINAGPDTLICFSTYTMQGSSPGSGTGSWRLLSGSGNFSNLTDSNTTVSGLSPGINRFEWSILVGNCAFSDTVTLDTRQSGFANAGSDSSICGNSLQLGALSPVNGSGQWSVTSGSGMFVDNLLANTVVNGLSPGLNILQWKVSDSLCVDSSEVFIISFDAASAQSTPNDSVCGPNGTLQAISPAAGVGSWSLVSGGGVLADSSLPMTMVSGLVAGANVFQWIVSNGPCADTSTTTLISLGFPAVDAGPTDSICGTSVMLQASLPTGSAGGWSVTAGGGNIVNPTDPNSQVNGLSFGINTYTWKVNNGVCSDSSSVNIYAFEQVNALALNDTTVCGNRADISALPPTTGIGMWSNLGGNSQIGDPSQPNTLVSDLSPGPNSFVWRVINGPCLEEDTLEAFSWPSPDMANAGPDQTLSGATSTILEGNNPLVGNGYWMFISGPTQISFQDSTQFDTEVFNLSATGQYVLSWWIGNGICPANEDQMKINVSVGLVVPQVITANGDGKNDTWEIQGLENFGTARVTILNRWGNIIFETNDYQNDWAGLSNQGKEVSDDTYFYILELPDTEAFKGFFVLKR